MRLMVYGFLGLWVEELRNCWLYSGKDGLAGITGMPIPHVTFRRGFFENLVIAEFIKERYHKGLRSNAYFRRDNKGSEVDFLIDEGEQLLPVEIKSGSSFDPGFFKSLLYWNKLAGKSGAADSYVIYGGNTDRSYLEGNLISWKRIHILGKD